MKTRKAFDINSGKNLHNVELVDKNGNPIDVYPTPDGSAVFIIGGTAYSMEEAEDMLFEEIDDEHIDVYKTDVSDYAKEFQQNEDYYVKKKIRECSNWFFDLIGIFTHRAFFTQKMWKQVPGFEDEDEGEIIAVFMHWWFRDRYGFQNKPYGCKWRTDCPTVYTQCDEFYNDYINKYQPVLKAYSDWCEAQR